MRSGDVPRAVAKGSRPSGARGAMKDMARGRVAGFTRAWGAPPGRDRGWQTTWWREKAGEDCGVYSGMAAPADSEQGLADDVVEGEGAGVDCVAAEDRALG